MSSYQMNLPQLDGDLFVTDGGIETSLIFDQGCELPEFAAFVLLASEDGREALTRYFQPYGALSKANRVGLILESATWRANPDWAAKVGYSPEALAAANRDAVQLLVDIRAQYETQHNPIVISGNVGPRGDGYQPESFMSAAEAEDYHQVQIHALRDTSIDMISALTMTYAEEAIGISQAAHAAGLPVVISFTVETDGSLPSGQPLNEAIEQVDEATNSIPAYYMINCAHPTHFDSTLVAGQPWVDRIQGLRVNASALSHAELDEAEELDSGNPAELGHQLQGLTAQFQNLNVLGGCCGTDHRHIEAIYHACKG